MFGVNIAAEMELLNTLLCLDVEDAHAPFHGKGGHHATIHAERDSNALLLFVHRFTPFFGDFQLVTEAKAVHGHPTSVIPDAENVIGR